MGKLKRRIRPGDITINIGKDAPIPECPIPGERYYSSKSYFTWRRNLKSKRIVYATKLRACFSNH